jgi:hypothetical protein
MKSDLNRHIFVSTSTVILAEGSKDARQLLTLSHLSDQHIHILIDEITAAPLAACRTLPSK